MTLFEQHRHLMHMRWLIYRNAIAKAVRAAHEEMRNYRDSFREMLRQQAGR